MIRIYKRVSNTTTKFGVSIQMRMKLINIKIWIYFSSSIQWYNISAIQYSAHTEKTKRMNLEQLKWQFPRRSCAFVLVETQSRKQIYTLKIFFACHGQKIKANRHHYYLQAGRVKTKTKHLCKVTKWLNKYYDAYLTCSSIRNISTFQEPSRPKFGRNPL